MSHPASASRSLSQAMLTSLSTAGPHSLHPLPSNILLSPAPTPPLDNIDALIDQTRGSLSSNNATVSEVVAATILLHSLTDPHSTATHLTLPRPLLPAAFKASYRKLKALNQLLANTPGNTLCGAILSAMKDTYRLSLLMDANFGTGLSDHERLESSVTLLQDTFSKSLNDRTEFVISDTESPLSATGSKKALVLSVVNYLFASYFKLNTLRLCKNVQRPVEARKLHSAVNNVGGKAAMLTYRYYTGRLGMFEDEYGMAEEGLSYAYVWQELSHRRGNNLQ